MKTHTAWLIATICVIFSQRAGATEKAEETPLGSENMTDSSPASEGVHSGKAELTGVENKAAGEVNQSSKHVAPREIPHLREAFADLAELVAKAGERPRAAGISRAMSVGDLAEAQAMPKKRPTKSLTYEDIEAKRRETEKNTPEAMNSPENAKKYIFDMSRKQQAKEKQKKGGGWGIFSYFALGILVLGVLAGVAFFVCKFVLNK